MKTATKRTAKFRVGDWVIILWAVRTVLAQVIEDRGKLGYRGRRLYDIRLDWDEEEPTITAVGEEDLEAATEADVDSWRRNKSLGIHQPISYFPPGKNGQAGQKPLFRYLIVAKPECASGSGRASIIDLSGLRHIGDPIEPSPIFVAPAGGPEAALQLAEEYLDSKHPGLRKSVGEKRK